MKGNLVIVQYNYGNNAVYTLPDCFEIEVKLSICNLSIVFTYADDYKKNSFAVEIANLFDEALLIDGLNNLDAEKRDIITDEICNLVTDDIVGFIMKGANTEISYAINDSALGWIEHAQGLLEYYSTNPAD